MLEDDGRIYDYELSCGLSLLAAQWQISSVACAGHRHEVRKGFETSECVEYRERKPVADDNSKNYRNQNWHSELHRASDLPWREHISCAMRTVGEQQIATLQTSSMMIPEEIVRVIAAAMAAAPTDA